MTEQTLKVGDRLWCHDYRNNRKPWFDDEIRGETRVSWFVGAYPCKVNKKTMLENCGAMGNRRWHTAASMAEWKWLNSQPRKIAALVETCRDIETLLRVATLVGHVVDSPYDTTEFPPHNRSTPAREAS